MESSQDELLDKDFICGKVKSRTDNSINENPKSFENLNRLTSKLFSGGIFDELFRKKIISRKVKDSLVLVEFIYLYVHIASI